MKAQHTVFVRTTCLSKWESGACLGSGADKPKKHSENYSLTCHRVKHHRMHEQNIQTSSIVLRV
ncbi:hypothetical protein NIES4071_101280 (plasmid) [Calothrix sp. NIES-4071]|nr:hypothetical protein NIES4071_101280 [Calothrix sp. NIES-4071]BAZ64509.1 hypothetical protein NIES4105_102420 [Calothrix sp. NIES-4105]